MRDGLIDCFRRNHWDGQFICGTVSTGKWERLANLALPGADEQQLFTVEMKLNAIFSEDQENYVPAPQCALHEPVDHRRGVLCILDENSQGSKNSQRRGEKRPAPLELKFDLASAGDANLAKNLKGEKVKIWIVAAALADPNHEITTDLASGPFKGRKNFHLDSSTGVIVGICLSWVEVYVAEINQHIPSNLDSGDDDLEPENVVVALDPHHSAIRDLTRTILQLAKEKDDKKLLAAAVQPVMVIANSVRYRDVTLKAFAGVLPAHEGLPQGLYPGVAVAVALALNRDGRDHVLNKMDDPRIIEQDELPPNAEMFSNIPRTDDDFDGKIFGNALIVVDSGFSGVDSFTLGVDGDYVIEITSFLRNKGWSVSLLTYDAAKTALESNPTAFQLVHFSPAVYATIKNDINSSSSIFKFIDNLAEDAPFVVPPLAAFTAEDDMLQFDVAQSNFQKELGQILKADADMVMIFLDETCVSCQAKVRKSVVPRDPTAVSGIRSIIDPKTGHVTMSTKLFIWDLASRKLKRGGDHATKYAYTTLVELTTGKFGTLPKLLQNDIAKAAGLSEYCSTH